MGYVALHEWVNGYREVVSFQGDVATFNLMSERIEPIPFRAKTIEVPKSTCNYLYVVAIVTSVALVGVACITAAYTLIRPSRSADGLHLLLYNRVVGPVWVGRPLLLLRASAAITMLSTAPLAFVNEHGVARFHFSSRLLTHIGILAGEATWVTYVLNDILLVVANQYSQWAAPLSTWLVWFSLVVLEVLYPIRATAAIDRHCTRFNVDAVVTCRSGVVNLGSLDRASLILVLNFVAVGFAYSVVCIFRSLQRVAPATSGGHAKLTHLVSAGAEVFLAPKESDMWSLDASSAAMSGFLRFRFQTLRCIFDTKLWLFFFASKGPDLFRAPIGPTETTSRRASFKTDPTSVFAKLKVYSGLIYLAATAVGSISYLRLSTVNLANDLWWATYNTTGTQTFLSNWFNRYLFFNASQPSTRLDLPVFADMTDYSASSTLVTYAPTYARFVQYETGSDLFMMIQGLRSMDACNAPWIATSYCWLDFDRQVEMANTLGRQARCDAKYHSNGAVYLESILRNVDWPTFESCWGTSFEIGVAKDIGSLKPNGAAWLTSLVSGSRLSVVDEAKVWQSKGLTTYTTQWQNYKALGLHDVFSIENAFGLRYDMTLQSKNGSYHPSMSTSWKAYWTFASDLWAIATNGSGIAGRSLLRPSPHFAFANTSLQSLMVLNSTLQLPLGEVLDAFHDDVGVFGAVDVFHVPYPASLSRLQRAITSELTTLLAKNTDEMAASRAQADFGSMILMSSLSPVPKYLDRTTYLCSGGNLFCPEVPTAFNFSIGMSQFTGVDTTCYNSFNDWVYVTPVQMVFAVIASGIALDPTTLIPVACASEVIAPSQCLVVLESVSTFVSTHFAPSVLEQYRVEAVAVEADVIGASVGFMQYARHVPTNRVELFHQVLFDPSDATMHFSNWGLAYEWTVGSREVIRVDGDVSSLAVFSTISFAASFAASGIEMPLNVATYLRGLCQYISFVLAAIALIAGLYTLANGCTSEGLNLFEVNRVGGLTWIGRPLLFVRSVTALCILSTATLQLQKTGIMTQLTASRDDVEPFIAYITKILAASELGWLVYIFDDLCMAWTRQYSASYTPKTAMTAWLIAIVLSFTSPVSHSATIQRSCSLGEMDFEMVCHSGVVAIGSVSRLLLLVGIALGGSTLLYITDRLWHTLPPLDERDSFLVTCSAKYLFERKGWVHDRIYFIDFASAALTGLLVCWYKGDLYVFDIKTWRTLVLHRSDLQAATASHPSAAHLARALPLIR
ncbi:hypothetical protein SDRG_14874 [Saprolegnia diclina VS20]|uniref:Uncharacterized protein n=1 Tax=Saprolegnia diclina (strain VS20) TaxID=1156394 RepID=T0PYN8_SAPDV|nr:hypothetical protein SDRG_14874 [Saprolegnia diclina VS20]EQC27351.1 hypothetical protein SDRG_14874 [Saprolegnia diclina VS20]|eukprot:XP_008619255.1 hypothetical protein SDRG_14874 [Saprolegnia diclina VS20]